MRNLAIALVRSFFVCSTWLFCDGRREPSACQYLPGLTTGAGWTQGPLTGPGSHQEVGGGSACGGVRMTATGTSQQWPAIERGPGQGEEWELHSSIPLRRRERHFQAVCVTELE